MRRIIGQVLGAMFFGSMLLPGQVFAAIIGFEGIAPEGGSVGFGTEEMPVPAATPYTEAGFVLSTTEDSGPGPYISGIIDSLALETEAHLVGNGSDMYVFLGSAFQVFHTLEQENGDPFSLISLDVGSVLRDYIGPDESLVVTGNLFGGGTVTQLLPLEVNLFPTFSLDPEFTNLSSVIFSASLQGNATIFGLDNINVEAGHEEIPPVPVPAAAWLFGTALVGLIGFGKRRIAA